MRHGWTTCGATLQSKKNKGLLHQIQCSSPLLCGTICNALRVTLGIISGKIISIFVAQKRLRAFLSHFFTAGGRDWKLHFAFITFFVKMRLERSAERDKREIKIIIPLKISRA